MSGDCRSTPVKGTMRFIAGVPSSNSKLPVNRPVAGTSVVFHLILLAAGSNTVTKLVALSAALEGRSAS